MLKIKISKPVVILAVLVNCVSLVAKLHTHAFGVRGHFFVLYYVYEDISRVYMHLISDGSDDLVSVKLIRSHLLDREVGFSSSSEVSPEGTLSDLQTVSL